MDEGAVMYDKGDYKNIKFDILDFDWLKKDRICAHVWANPNTGEVKCEQYTDKIYEMFAGKWYKEMTYDNLLMVLERRCFPRSRVNADDILESLGLSSYSPVDIVKKTHGHMAKDPFWIRFSYESDMTYEKMLEFFR